MLWEVMSYGERPYWEMSNQDVSTGAITAARPPLWENRTDVTVGNEVKEPNGFGEDVYGTSE